MKILLISHGNFAEGILQSATMIVGKQNNIHFVSLDEKGIEDFEEKLCKVLDTFKEDRLIVLSDILGGSPNSTTLRVLDEKNMLEMSTVITGMNLPLLIGIILSNGDLSTDELNNIIEDSKNSMSIYKINKNTSLIEDDIL